MTAEKILLGAIINIKKGSYITKKEANEGPYPVILGGQEPAYYIDKYNHTGRAIVISRSGASAGYVSRWNEPIFVTDGFLIEPKEAVDFDYLYYLLKYHQPQLQGLQGGAAIPHVNPRIINAIEVIFPSIDEQTAIAGILSDYDNLIENNQKQIKLLEEAAQRLYKEWFIDFRFPGHEDTPIVDGVPEGWKKCLLGDINCSLESGSRPKGGIDASLVDGVPSIGAENVIGLGCYNYSSEKLITKDFFSKMKRGKLCDKDILIYKDGAYIGRTSLFQDGFPHLEAAVNEHVFLLHAADEHIQYYLFFTLYQQEYYQKMQKLNKNAAQPGINSKAMMSLPVLLPTEDILDGFDSFATPLMHKIFNLAKQNRRLELARDRLLPKLMSGEIEVQEVLV